MQFSVSNLKVDDKRWLGTLLRDQICSIKDLHAKYEIPLRTSYKYQLVFSETNGRPRLLNQKYYPEIIEYLAGGNFNKTTSQFKNRNWSKNSRPQQKMEVQGLILVQFALMNCIHCIAQSQIHLVVDNKVLQNCTTRLSYQEEQKIINQMNELKNIILTRRNI